MEEKDIVEMIRDAHAKFLRAVKDLIIEERKNKMIPEVRLRRFVLNGYGGKKVYWPYQTFDKIESVSYFAKEDGSRSRIMFSDYFVTEFCQHDPRAYLRVLRQVEVMHDWAMRVLKGRERAIKEIDRQKARFIETLEAEKALQELGRQN